MAATTPARAWTMRAPSGLTVASLTVLGATAPGIEQEFGVGSSALAVAFAGQLVGAVLGSWTTGASSHALLRKRPAAVAAAGAVLLAGAASAFWVLAVAMLATGWACFVMNTRAQADVAIQAGEGRAHAVSAFHVWGGGGGFLFPLLVALALAAGLDWRWGFAIMAALLLVYAALAAGGYEAAHTPRAVARPAITRPAALALACGALAVAVQVTIPLFMATLLVADFGTSDAAGTAGLAVYSFCLFISRLLGTRLLVRLGTERELTITIALALAGCPLIAFGPGALALVAGAALTGLGVGQIFPLAMIRSAALLHDDRYATSLAFALNSLCQMTLPGVVAVALATTGLRTALAVTIWTALAAVAVTAAGSRPKAATSRPA